jgi:hypothetical protein
MKHPSLLKLSAASCGESSILKKNKTPRLCSLTPRQAAGSALAGGFKTILKPWIIVTLAALLQTGALFTTGTEAVA